MHHRHRWILAPHWTSPTLRSATFSRRARSEPTNPNHQRITVQNRLPLIPLQWNEKHLLHQSKIIFLLFHVRLRPCPQPKTFLNYRKSNTSNRSWRNDFFRRSLSSNSTKTRMSMTSYPLPKRSSLIFNTLMKFVWLRFERNSMNHCIHGSLPSEWKTTPLGRGSSVNYLINCTRNPHPVIHH